VGAGASAAISGFVTLISELALSEAIIAIAKRNNTSLFMILEIFRLIG